MSQADAKPVHLYVVAGHDGVRVQIQRRGGAGAIQSQRQIRRVLQVGQCKMAVDVCGNSRISQILNRAVDLDGGSRRSDTGIVKVDAIAFDPQWQRYSKSDWGIPAGDDVQRLKGKPAAISWLQHAVPKLCLQIIAMHIQFLLAVGEKQSSIR